MGFCNNWFTDAEMGYMAHMVQIEEAIDRLAASPSQCNDFDFQCQVYDEVGLDSDTLTNSEIEYMQNEIAKRM